MVWRLVEVSDMEYDGPTNIFVEVAFAEFLGPFEVYKNAYKYTACGPTVGFLVRDTTEEEPDRWYYGDQLRKLGTWKNLENRGLLITHISVSSIVEGIDETTTTHVLNVSEPWLEQCANEGDCGEPAATLRRVFYETVDLVDQEAAQLWTETHGCDVCADRYGRHGEGTSPIWPECPNCGGEGVTF